MTESLKAQIQAMEDTNIAAGNFKETSLSQVLRDSNRLSKDGVATGGPNTLNVAAPASKQVTGDNGSASGRKVNADEPTETVT
jgi:hypothetical protein